MSKNTDYDLVLDIYRNHYLFMIDKDTDSLSKLLDDKFSLTHMTGYKQSKVEWLHQIDTEEMRYFSSKEDNIMVTLNGKKAKLIGQNRVDARINGYRSTWNLQLEMELARIENTWKIIKTVASVY